jgi:hypothetical protein
MFIATKNQTEFKDQKSGRKEFIHKPDIPKDRNR